jgi:rRNA maturation RNase YbeY
MKVLFYTEVEIPHDVQDNFKLLCRLAEGIIGGMPGNLNVVLSTDTYLRKLNKQHRGKDKPTDVLSFTYDDFDSLIGEVFISVETAVRQAKQKRHGLEKELYILFVHGLLHVRGYDHEKDEDYRVMKLLEKKVLKIFYSNPKQCIQN